MVGGSVVAMPRDAPCPGAPGAELQALAQRSWETGVLPALERYTAIPCLSPDFDEHWEAAGHLAQAASLLAEWAAARPVDGVRVEVLGGKGTTPLLLADAPGTGGRTGTVLVYGHMDKQPPLGAWREGLEPFRAVREGDRLYGRGTADDGYALFAAMSAVEILDAAGAPRPRVVVLVEAGEESGSPDLPGHLDAVSPGLGSPDLVVCLDSGCLSYDRLWLTTSLRGNLVATVSVQVLDEGVHSGSAGGVVPTSFRLLRVLLDRIEDPRTGEIRPAALHAAGGVAAHMSAPPEWDGAIPFPVVSGLELEGASDAERLVRRAWSPALAVTGMDGIPSVRDGGNVLRPSTTAKLSLRLPPTVDATIAASALESALRAEPPSGARVEVRVESAATGWRAPPLDGWVGDAFARASHELFARPPGSLGEGGTIPLFAMLTDRYPGTPLVATGVLGPGANAHGPNEFLHLPMAEAVTVATARLVEAAGTRPTGDPG